MQPGFLFTITGSVNFINLVTATGSATISITNQAFVISFNLSLELGGALQIAASGFAGIYNDANPGLVLELNASINATIAQVIDLDASGTLLLNTTGTTRTANGFTLGAGSFSLMLNGSVSIFKVLTFNANFEIVVGGNQTVTFNDILGNGQTHRFSETLGEGDWYVSFNASMSFFGLATLSAYGMFDYQGQFAVGLSGDLLLGTHDFGIEGQFSINTSFYWTNPSTQFGVNFDINGSASVTARLFGIDFASLGVSFDASIATNTGGTAEVSLSVTVHIHILFITISATAHFDIGTIQFPKPFYLAGDQSNAQVWDSTVDDGTLYLNTGSRAQYRQLGPSSDTDTSQGSNPSESYIIDDEGGTAASGETIKVTAFGHSQTFTGVKRIVDDASDPNNIDSESLIVDPGVQVPVVFIGGPNNDNFVDDGNGYAVAVDHDAASSAKTEDEFVAGPSVPAAVLVGGPAYSNISNLSGSPSFLVGGAGNNQIAGGTGNDTIYGHATVNYASPDSWQSYGANGWTLSLGGVQATEVAAGSVSGSDTIDGGGGNDYIDAGNGNNAVSWEVQPIAITSPYLGGQGTDYLYINAPSPSFLDVTQPTAGTLQIADQSSTGTTLGNLQAQGFSDLVLNGGASANDFTIQDLGGTGIGNVTINAGQDIVPTGQTQTVNDPNNPGLQIQEPVVNVLPHTGADAIDILGTNGNDTFTLAEDNANQAGQMTQVQVTDADGNGDTINFTITNSVASQGDTLTIDSLNGSDTINAGGMGPSTAAQAPEFPAVDRPGRAGRLGDRHDHHLADVQRPGPPGHGQRHGRRRPGTGDLRRGSQPHRDRHPDRKPQRRLRPLQRQARDGHGPGGQRRQRDDLGLRERPVPDRAAAHQPVRPGHAQFPAQRRGGQLPVRLRDRADR